MSVDMVNGFTDAVPRSPSRPPVRSFGRRRSRYERLGKPVLDVVVAVLLLVIALPVIIVAAVLAAAVTPGELRRQPRIGLQGRTFTIPQLVLDTTRSTGRALAVLHVDRLLLLPSVLRGHMSLVGPAPEHPDVVDSRYERWAHERHTVKPGLTGEWQVSGERGRPLYDYIGMDLDYVDRIDLLTDLSILARTIPAVLRSSRRRARAEIDRWTGYSWALTAARPPTPESVRTTHGHQ